MVNESEHFRHVLFFDFRKGKNTVKARTKLCAVYMDVLSVRQCQKWFPKFRSGNFDLEDAPHPDRPIKEGYIRCTNKFPPFDKTSRHQ